MVEYQIIVPTTPMPKIAHPTRNSLKVRMFSFDASAAIISPIIYIVAKKITDCLLPRLSIIIPEKTANGMQTTYWLTAMS
jgi:hypothetical protein